MLFADLRGFSAISAAFPPDVVLGLLGRCFTVLSEIATRHFGTIDKFIGDAIMVVFDHAQRAALCAVEMQIGIHELRQRHREAGMPDIHVGIGIASGKVMAGLIGSDAHRTFTVMGEVVNLAARIEAFSLRGQVLMSETTYRQCADFVRVGEPMSVYVKGQADGVPIRELLAIPSSARPSRGKTCARALASRSTSTSNTGRWRARWSTAEAARHGAQHRLPRRACRGQGAAAAL